MAKKLMLLAFASMLVVTSRISSVVQANTHVTQTLVYSSPGTPPAMPTPHVPKYCAQGCVKYCDYPLNPQKRICQRICSKCCQNNCGCIPFPETPCASWGTVMMHGTNWGCP